MIKVSNKLLTIVGICAFALCLAPTSIKATSVGHATGHATPHTTAPHVTVRSTPRVSPGRPSPRINTNTNARTSPKANINKGATPPTRTTPRTKVDTNGIGKSGLKSGSNTRRSIGSVSEYKSLTNDKQKSSYSKWSNYYTQNYPGRSANSIYSSYYYWIPYWILLSNQRKNVASSDVPTDNQGNPRRWIKVGDKIIFVPENIWKKVNKGDKVKLVDDKHIEINGKTYER